MSALLTALNGELAAAVQRASRSLVQVRSGRGGGAGPSWHAGGLVITNAHVVVTQRRSRRGGALEVVLPDGAVLPAQLLAADPRRDLAALVVRAPDLEPIALGDSRRLQPGDWLMAVGHPWGVLGAATAGSVIGVGPSPELAYRGDLIQVGLHMRPGHSGGALVDGTGRLHGINTMIAGPDVGLAVPVHVVADFLRETMA